MSGNSAADDAKTVIGGNWPPYARTGGEANWTDRTPVAVEEPKVATDWAEESQRAPIMVLPDYSPFELRKAALEAACAIQRDGKDPGTFWRNLQSLENYLRDGTKPS